jgi:hypothetical protein
MWSTDTPAHPEATPYIAGSLGISAGATTVASGALIAQGFGYSARIAIHPAHHTFGKLGNLKHIQINLWKQGVKGSGKVIRIPLP